MGNCCLTALVGELVSGGEDPRVLCHTRSIHPARGSRSSGSGLRWVVTHDGDAGDISCCYELGEELGRGQFGVIRLCTDRCGTGRRLACKSIAKSKLGTAGDVDDVQREIDILRQLSGHPNIVSLVAVFEDEASVHLVMELCDGGELFDRIVERRRYAEPEAAQLLATLMQALRFCHDNGVIHRDLKPENILFAADGTLKLADFGLAVRFREGDSHSGLAGSAYYIAPEVLAGEYGPEVDVWSAGVVLYVLLCGVPPFWDETEEGIFDAIRQGHVDLSSEPWPRVSCAAKDLIRRMLCADVAKRLTPTQVLEHEWIVKYSAQRDDAKQQQQEEESGAATPPHLASLSWRSWQTSSASRSSSCSSLCSNDQVDVRHAVTFSGSGEPLRQQERPLEKWTSFTQVVEPTLEELVAAVQDKESGTATVIGARRWKRSVLVTTDKGRFVVVHDKLQRRIGWKQLSSAVAEDAFLELPSSASPPSHLVEKLLWSSLPDDGTTSA